MEEIKLHPTEREYSVYLSIGPSSDEPDCFSGNAKELFSNGANSFYRVEPSIERLIDLLQALKDEGYEVEDGHINISTLRMETEDEFLSRVDSHVKFCSGMLSQSKKNIEALGEKLERLEKGVEDYESAIRRVQGWKVDRGLGE